MPCGNLGDTESWECERPRVFGVTQIYLTSSIYTRVKDVTKGFWINEEDNLL